MQFLFNLIISSQVHVELFTSMTLTSPYFSPSPLRKHARTCHLHCSAFLTHSYNICSPYNGHKEVTWPWGWRSSNLLHPIGYRDMDMTTHHLPGSSGLGWPLLVCVTQSSVKYKREICNDILSSGKKRMANASIYTIHANLSVFIILSTFSHWSIEGNYSKLNICLIIWLILVSVYI